MKTTIILLFILATSPCIGQQSLFVKMDLGQSKHFNYGINNGSNNSFTLNPVLSGGTDATYELAKFRIISPYAGIGVSFLGTILQLNDHAVYPGKKFRFRHIYLTLPAGLKIPVYKAVGIDIALINSWRLNDRASEIVGNPRIWDVALQPGVFINIENWRLGFSYYYGIRDVFGVGYIGSTDSRHYNRALHINVAYKLKNFGSK